MWTSFYKTKVWAFPYKLVSIYGTYRKIYNEMFIVRGCRSEEAMKQLQEVISKRLKEVKEAKFKTPSKSRNFHFC